jgi:hypothetical protein
VTDGFFFRSKLVFWHKKSENVKICKKIKNKFASETNTFHISYVESKNSSKWSRPKRGHFREKLYMLLEVTNAYYISNF